MPENLQERAISIAHEGHKGLVKTMLLLWEKLWFLKINDRVKVRIDHYMQILQEAGQTLCRCLPYHQNHGSQFLWNISHG